MKEEASRPTERIAAWLARRGRGRRSEPEPRRFVMASGAGFSMTSDGHRVIVTSSPIPTRPSAEALPPQPDQEVSRRTNGAAVRVVPATVDSLVDIPARDKEADPEDRPLTGQELVAAVKGHIAEKKAHGVELTAEEKRFDEDEDHQRILIAGFTAAETVSERVAAGNGTAKDESTMQTVARIRAELEGMLRPQEEDPAAAAGRDARGTETGRAERERRSIIDDGLADDEELLIEEEAARSRPASGNREEDTARTLQSRRARHLPGIHSNIPGPAAGPGPASGNREEDTNGDLQPKRAQSPVPGIRSVRFQVAERPEPLNVGNPQDLERALEGLVIGPDIHSPGPEDNAVAPAEEVVVDTSTAEPDAPPPGYTAQGLYIGTVGQSIASMLYRDSEQEHAARREQIIFEGLNPRKRPKDAKERQKLFAAEYPMSMYLQGNRLGDIIDKWHERYPGVQYDKDGALFFKAVHVDERGRYVSIYAGNQIVYVPGEIVRSKKVRGPTYADEVFERGISVGNEWVAHQYGRKWGRDLPYKVIALWVPHSELQKVNLKGGYHPGKINVNSALVIGEVNYGR